MKKKSSTKSKKSNTNAVLARKILAANSIYIAISWFARNQDPINVMVVMLDLTEKMGWLVIIQVAKVEIIKSAVYVAKC